MYACMHMRVSLCITSVYYVVSVLLCRFALGFDIQGPKNKVVVLFDSSNHLHRDRSFHYENPERITACIESLHKYALNNDVNSNSVELIDIAPTIYDSTTPKWIQTINCQKYPVTADELHQARNILLQTHQTELITELEERCSKSKEQRIMDGKSPLGYIGYLDGGDTYVTTETYDVCLRATVAWIRALNYCYLNNNYFAMACTRPPGHHATYSLQNGFCLFNFAAAAAIHALSYRNVSKVSILDWDVHYGQGVADIITSRYSDQIRYVSIHQTPAFPYEGEYRRTRDNVMTIPIAPDTTWTCGYSEVFENALQFCATTEEWQPDLIIICAGYDALSNDELASVNLDAVDYGRMVHRLCQHLSETCNKRKPKIMLGLEGGYKINSGGSSGNLPDAVIETVKGLLGQTYI
jgi:acetoin utilization deacetylase AcuC-like enzyme